MKKYSDKFLILFTILSCFFNNTCFGQNSLLKKEAIDIGDTELGYPKNAKGLIQRKVGIVQDNTELNTLISDAMFRSFTEEEKFAFCIAYPENFYQNCAGVATTFNNLKTKRLYGYLSTGDGYMLSPRQDSCLQSIRNYLMNAIKQDAEVKGYLPKNYKQALISIDAVEMIPWLVDFFKRKTKEKDGDILTIFFQLMVNHQYPPFMQSKSYQWLFVYSETRPNSIEFNSANGKLTIERVMGLYSSIQK